MVEKFTTSGSLVSLTESSSLLDPDELNKIDAYWRAANYLSVGQIYLLDNPLLKDPISPKDVKKRLLGHWGTTPGLNFIYVHLNRMIKLYDLDMIFLTGPGHGAPGVIANVYLEGSYSEFYPTISQDVEGMQRLFKQFSFPGGIPSHTAPETPGSINEGGELGYVLAHAYGATFDNPDLIASCVIGDGEAETGPLAASWHSNKFLNPIRDGAVLPILHLNGYKIANPTILARISDQELESLFIGYGYHPLFVRGSDHEEMHQLMASTLETAIQKIKEIQKNARDKGDTTRPRWPMIIFQSPKGWTGPATVDTKQMEGSWRSHQVPFSDFATNPSRYKLLEEWLKSYRPEELFDQNGRLNPNLADLAPKGIKRMGSNPHANGGILLKELSMPDFRRYALSLSAPGVVVAESTRIAGDFLRDVMKLNIPTKNFRVFGPDETASNRLDAVFDVTNRTFNAKIYPSDDKLSPDGRVMEVLSEHLCQGWLEGYLLTGRHGFFSCYEAFIHVVDSMFNQHAKWLKSARQISWRKPIASLNYLLTSHVWRQDHNGFSHQDPGFIDIVVNKKAEIIRVYLPPDANTLLSVTDHCLKSKNYVNVIIAGKQPQLQYLNIQEAIDHCTKGIGIWAWASGDPKEEPDVVIACAGDVPTMEALAAVSLLRSHFPDLNIRFVNVVDLMVLQPQTEHPHGLSERDFDLLFTVDKPVIFAFHGYPWLIHRLTYRRKNHSNIHVRGYKEEGTTTTPFDMAVLNDIDRFHLMEDVVKRIPRLKGTLDFMHKLVADKIAEHKAYIYEYGEDLPEIRNWKWSGKYE
jgi:xylulose-5-phosphate/fructose-6-phosphate phosphoketolase